MPPLHALAPIADIGRGSRPSSPGRRDRGQPQPRELRELPAPSQPDLPSAGHQVTIENIPDDMSWLELKDLGKQYGPSVSFSRTYRRGSTFLGTLEYAEAADASRCIQALNGRRIQGGAEPMRAYEGNAWNA